MTRGSFPGMVEAMLAGALFAALLIGADALWPLAVERWF